MSKSYKVPVYKNKGMKDIYHRLVKRRIRNYLKSNFFKLQDKDFDCNIPNPRTIVNDYNSCDYRFDARFDARFGKNLEKWRSKLSRK